ncbi:MAG TPA: hypothetical protein VHX42_03195 [Candidatus Babeliales bacterium]|jgi:hypothetical protein|nr:hypothetical protein [Candidatus Babeliales bacterium]
MIIILFFLFFILNNHGSEHSYIVELQKKWDHLQTTLENKKNNAFQYNEQKRTLHCIYHTNSKIIIDHPGNYYRSDIKFLGYSPLGITVIAPHLTIEQKRTIMEKVIPNRLIPTEKDKELAYLEWWKRIPLQQIILLHCVTQKNTIFFPLPSELIHLILIRMAQAEKPLF